MHWILILTNPSTLLTIISYNQLQKISVGNGVGEISSGVEEDLGREREREERIPLKREQQDRQNIVMALRSVALGPLRYTS